MAGHRFEAIKPLLEAQSYIHGVQWCDNKNGEITHDLSTFRHDIRKGESLAHWQARHLGVEISTEPWLTVTPALRAQGRVVFSRSARYHNGFFPWFRLLKSHPWPLFVGSREEHSNFQAEFKCKVEYVTTANLLELAQVIAGCEAFYGNQSCPFWIAIGLGVPVRQETWPHDANSRIERENALYGLTFEDCEVIQ